MARYQERRPGLQAPRFRWFAAHRSLESPHTFLLDLLHPLADRLKDGGLTDVTVVTYPDARHEILNETNSAEVIGALIEWANRVVAS